MFRKRAGEGGVGGRGVGGPRERAQGVGAKEGRVAASLFGELDLRVRSHAGDRLVLPEAPVAGKERPVRAGKGVAGGEEAARLFEERGGGTPMLRANLDCHGVQAGLGAKLSGCVGLQRLSIKEAGLIELTGGLNDPTEFDQGEAAVGVAPLLARQFPQRRDRLRRPSELEENLCLGKARGESGWIVLRARRRRGEARRRICGLSLGNEHLREPKLGACREGAVWETAEDLLVACAGIARLSEGAEALGGAVGGLLNPLRVGKPLNVFPVLGECEIVEVLCEDPVRGGELRLRGGIVLGGGGMPHERGAEAEREGGGDPLGEGHRHPGV